MTRDKASRGFSLIELLFVLVVVSILAALAVPHINRTKMTANEKAALASLRTIMEAQALYFARFAIYGTMEQLIDQQMVDESLSAAKSGYVFSIDDVGSFNFSVYADPSTEGVSGEKHYYGDGSGVIRYTEDGSLAGPSSPPVNTSGM